VLSIQGLLRDACWRPGQILGSTYDLCDLSKHFGREIPLDFVQVVKGFLGNHRAENYIKLVETLVKNYSKMDCRMSLKVHVLDAYLHSFKENMDAYFEEQGKRFHQDIQHFERHYQGTYNEHM